MLSAEHLPDLYEDVSLPAVLANLQQRFAQAFPFTSVIDKDGNVDFTFTDCSIGTTATQGGGTLGTDALCVLFHEYWAGLVGEFVKRKFSVETQRAEQPCSFKIVAK